MTLKRLGLWSIGLAVAIIALCGAVVVHAAAAPFIDTVQSPIYPTPMHRTISLDRGDYVVYTSSGGDITADPSDGSVHGVRILGPDGQPVPLAEASTPQTLNRDGESFRSIVEFHAPRAGAYAFSVLATSGTQVVVGRDLQKLIVSVLGWLAFGFLGGLILLAGVIMLIVAASRRRRHAAAASSASSNYPGYQSPSYPAAYPPVHPAGATNGWPTPASQRPPEPASNAAMPMPRAGWYPDPEARHKFRWWNGQHWEAPLPDQQEPGPAGHVED
ncbi:Protein of unknown function [Frankineae bacterium MT45]|nr:Protein of unknown function [Frankineae bacterium MT45]